MIALSEWLPPSRAAARHTAPRPGREAWATVTLCCCAEIEAATAGVLAAMSGHDYPLRDGFAVRLALVEALTNAVRHGNGGDPQRRVTLRHLVVHDHVWVEVEDEGHGFDPAGVPDPRTPENIGRTSGRGVFLMRAYMDRVEYEGRGNRVLMHKRRGGSPPNPTASQ